MDYKEVMEKERLQGEYVKRMGVAERERREQDEMDGNGRGKG